MEAGPRAVDSPADYPTLLARAGFEAVQHLDLTGDFLLTARAWMERSAESAVELARRVGEEEFSERQAERKIQIAAIEQGLLCRGMFWAIRP